MPDRDAPITKNNWPGSNLLQDLTSLLYNAFFMRDRYLFFAGCLVWSLLILSCSENQTQDPEQFRELDFDTISFDHSMKGWELYSWPNGSDWDYSLMVGTNTLKNYEIVINNPYTVTGLDQLKTMLSKMPADEEIAWMSENWLNNIWTTPCQDLMLPPTEIVTELDDFCVEHQLSLTIAYLADR
jgi:hypothetical protein